MGLAFSIGEPLGPIAIMGSGASCGISPCRDDFSSYALSSAQIKDLSDTTTVAGESLLHWTFLDVLVNPVLSG